MSAPHWRATPARVRPAAARAAAIILLGLGAGPPARAQPLSAYRSQHLGWFAKAFAVPESAVSGLRPIDVAGVPTSQGLLVGFVRRAGLTFAAVLPLWRCPGGAFCSKPELLSAGTAIHVSDVADLDARSSRFGPTRLHVTAIRPARPAAWPAIAIRVERRDGRERSTDLYILSLRAPATLLLRRIPASRSGEGGFETTGVRLERGTGGAPELVLAQQHELARSRSRCLRPGPTERRFRLVQGVFREVASLATPGRPSCR